MASVTYKIGGRYDGKAVKQAQSGFSSLKGTIANLKGVLSGLAIVSALKKVADYSKECTEAFSVQQKAISQLSVAVSNNRNLTQKSLQSIIGFTGKLQSKSIYGDEALQGQASYLAGLGLQEDQLKKVLEASVELSSAGVGNLESNVQNLAKTLTGTSGKLGQVIPEMKELTKAQLENGEAIDIILQKYNGFAENLATNTLEGATKQVGNLIGDIKEKLGSISGTLKFNAFQKLIPILEGINNWLDQNINKVLNIFLNLPEVGAKSLELLKGIARKIFTVDGITEYFKIVGTLMLTIMKNSLMVLYNVVVAIGETIWEPLKTGFEWIGYGIKLAFTTVVNFFIGKINGLVDGFVEKINWLIEKINVVRDFFGQDEIQKIGSVAQIEVKQVPTKPTDGVNTKAIENAWKNVGSSITNGVKNIVSGYKEAGEDLAELFGDELGTFHDGISEIMNRPVEIMGVGALSGETNTVTTDNNTSPVESASKGLTTLTSIIQTLGDVGQAVAYALQSNFIGLILMLIAKLVSALEGSSEKFSAFMDSIGNIMSIVADIIKPLVEDLIQPFLNGMKNLGTIIGYLLSPLMELANAILIPILDLLTQSLDFIAPIVKIVGTLLKLFIQLSPILNIFTALMKILGDVLKAVYNYILVPVVNFLLKIITAIGNFFIKMYNGVVGVLNSIEIFGWHPFNFSKKNELDYDSMSLKKIDDYSTYEGNGESGSSSGSSGGSASYTAQKDTYVNVYFENSLVGVENVEALAILLGREIRRAEAKNLI